MATVFFALVLVAINQSQIAAAETKSHYTEEKTLARAQRIPPRSEYLQLFSTEYSSNGMDGLVLHANPGSVMLVKAPAELKGKALRVCLNKTDDFSQVCNGSPRAEASFNRKFTFRRNKEYLLQFSTYMPGQFKFDFKQPEIITQIHQHANSGSPVFALSLDGDKYQACVRSDKLNSTQTVTVGPARFDRNEWIKWTLRYRPDTSGASSLTELYKNDELVFFANGQPNAYPADDEAYLKIGLYKWWWKTKPSDVTNRVLYFGDVNVLVRKSS